MEPSDRQYQRVATWLDGEPVELTPDEQALAEDIGRLEDALAVRMGAEPVAQLPPSARARAMRRVQAELARPGLRWGRVIRAFAAAAAMAVVASAALLMLQDKPVTPDRSEQVSYERVVELTGSTAFAAEVELISQEVDELEAETLASATGTGDYTPSSVLMEEAAEEMNEFWTDDPFEGLGG